MSATITFPAIIDAVGGTTAAASGSLSGLIFYVSIALFVSFLCSVLEAVLLSTSVSYVELKVAEGSRAGRLMQKHKENVERPISAILTLNTVAHTVGAAGAGAEAAALFGNQYIGLISAVLTLMILVFSEIIPKTIGAVYWKQLNPFAAYVIRGLVIVLYPVVRVFELMTGLLRPEKGEPTVTRMELEVMTNIGLQEGALIERERQIVRNLLHLHNVEVETIMTPRTVMMTESKDMTVQEFVRRHPSIPFSRIPLYDGNMDHISEYALRHQILERVAADEDSTRLEQLRHAMHAVPETNSVGEVLDEFIASKEQLFLVEDEYGGTAGLITLEDVIESLLGIEITDETDVVADLRELAQQRYLRKRDSQVASDDVAVHDSSQPTADGEDDRV